MEMELTGLQVFQSFLIIGLLIVGCIVLLRSFFRNKGSNRDGNGSHKLSTRVKYPSADVFRHTQRFFGFGLATAMALVLCSFSWTQYDKVHEVAFDYTPMDDIDVIIPRTAPPPPPPPPPPPIIEEVPIEELPEEDQPDIVDVSVEETTVIEEPVLPPAPKAKNAPLPPPPPVDEDIIPEIVVFAEQMPLFGGCADKACSDHKLMQFLYKKLKYPSIAQENGIEGKVYVQFVVERNGEVTDIKVVRDIGGGCGAAALKAIEGINKLPEAFTPGRQRGRAVRVLFTLPVTFKLTK